MAWQPRRASANMIAATVISAGLFVGGKSVSVATVDPECIVGSWPTSPITKGCFHEVTYSCPNYNDDCETGGGACNGPEPCGLYEAEAPSDGPLNTWANNCEGPDCRDQAGYLYESHLCYAREICATFCDPVGEEWFCWGESFEDEEWIDVFHEVASQQIECRTELASNQGEMTSRIDQLVSVVRSNLAYVAIAHIIWSS